MADDRNNTLRRLAKNYGITFKLPLDDWPAAHSSTFKVIELLGNEKFDSYGASLDNRSQDQPWTMQRKHRAEWLAKSASRLCGQQRNEAGWRLGLENDVLHRFSVEVACPNCRARVWRSEIEVSLCESSDLARSLEERKRDRKSCQCPPQDRPRDHYEIGTNPLFDDRAQELIIHDDALRSELPKQQPDRIYGLQATRNFKDLLSQQMPRASTRTGLTTVGDLVRSTPFKAASDPLLFPFLVLEAKSETSPNGFDDIQVQTAFPIWALLKLQEDLQSQMVDSRSCFDPLVWFFASRGDAWRVYGCSLVRGEDHEPNRYEINLLWNGSLTFKDSAIQLILIVDYILDWARDFYRPSILGQLKSIATGKTCDKISLCDDSDIHSMWGNISNWIPAPPSTINMMDLDDDIDYPAVAPEHQDLLPIAIPNTKLGLVRSAHITEFRFICLQITQSNVETLLWLASGHYQNKDDSFRAARELVNFIKRWDEMLLLNGADIDELEYLWTGNMRLDDNTTKYLSAEEFYVLLEYRCFISSSWEITREITCLAISKPAFRILISEAGFNIRHQPAEHLPKTVRPCKSTVLRECIECLRSGSPWQVLVSAIFCTLVSLYPLPEPKRTDFTPPVDLLGFGYIRFPRIKPFIWKFLEFSQEAAAMGYHQAPGVDRGELRKTFDGRGKQSKLVGRTLDPPFQRVSEIRVRNCEQVHHTNKCGRCCQNSQMELFIKNFATSRPHILSTYGSILVESLEEKDSSCETDTRHDLCLFVVENSANLEEEKALPLIIEDILQTNMLYHTIRHPVSKESDNLRAIVWNLPLPYRPPTDEQHTDVRNWCQELLGKRITDKGKPENMTDPWIHTQMLLHFLRLGSSFLVASVAVAQFYRDQNIAQKLPHTWQIEAHTTRMTLDHFYGWVARVYGKGKSSGDYEPSFPTPKLKLRGDVAAATRN